MATQASYLRKVMFSLFDKEATYDAGPAAWTTGSACQMSEYAAASKVQWDDEVAADGDSISGQEMATHQELVRQGVKLSYEEPRAKPNTLAGMMALALGTVASTQDGTETAYRHKVSMASAMTLPSIGAQVQHESGVQYKYTGLKASGFTLSRGGNDPFWSFSTEIIGSGKRVTAADAFVAAISESWLRWGDTKIYLKDTAGTPITVPTTPSQTAANLGGSEVNISSRILGCSIKLDNAHAGEMGYRAGSGMTRVSLHPTRRSATVEFSLECDTAEEANDIARYVSQTKLAMEINCNSGVLVDTTGGAFFYGFIILIPFMQLQPFERSEESERDTMQFTGKVLSDLTNPALVGFVYNVRSGYLA